MLFFLKHLTLIFLLFLNLSLGWSIGGIDICLQHEDKQTCVKLSVTVPGAQDGSLIQEGIFKGYNVTLSNQKIEVVSNQIAVRDDEGNFLMYSFINLGLLGNIIVPILYDLNNSGQYIKNFYIFPYDDRCKNVFLYLDKKKPYDGNMYPIDGYYYRFLTDGSGRSESSPSLTIVPSNFLLQFNKKTGDIFEGNLTNKSHIEMANKSLTFVRDMPFSNEVSVFGTVANVLEMYKSPLEAINYNQFEKNLIDRSPLLIFPKMQEDQYNGLGFNKIFKKEDGSPQLYSDNFNNAFFYDKYLCFFPALKDTEENDAYTSRSLDVVAHETGHYIFSTLRQDIAQRFQDVYARAFNESFGDCTAYFFLLQFDVIRKMILKTTHNNLTQSSFFSKIGEIFTNRDGASITKTLDNLPCEPHTLSESLTRSVYGILAKAYNKSYNDKYQIEYQKIKVREMNRARFRPQANRLIEPVITENEKSEILERVYKSLIKIYISSVVNYNYMSSEFNFAEFGREMWRQDQKINNSLLGKIIISSFYDQKINITDPNWIHTQCIVDQNENRHSTVSCGREFIVQSVGAFF